MLQVKLLFVSALAYGTNAGYLSGAHSSQLGSHGSHGGDSFLASALHAPSASFGPPSQTYGAPSQIHHHNHHPVTIQETLIEDHGPVLNGASLPGVGGLAAATILHDSNIAGPGGHHYGDSHGHGPAPIVSAPAPVYGAPQSSGPLVSGPASGPGFSGPGLGLPSSDLSAPAPTGQSEGNLLLDSTLPGSAGQIVGTSAAVGQPRVIGTTVTVGRPDAGATRYELQSVVQNVVRRIPVEVTRHIQVAVPQPVPVPVRQEVKVPVPQPYPVHVDVVKHVPYPVYKTEHVPVERPVPVEVVKEVPVEVIKKVHVPVERPYEVIKKIHVPIEKHVEVPVAVWKPYPLHIIKHVTHYKKKSCCW